MTWAHGKITVSFLYRSSNYIHPILTQLSLTQPREVGGEEHSVTYVRQCLIVGSRNFCVYYKINIAVATKSRAYSIAILFTTH